MFVAIRDLRHAKGRFALIATVVALLMLLVGFVSALAGGLASMNISALVNSGAQKVVFSMPSGASPSFATSSISDAELDAWTSRAEGRVTPVSLATLRLAKGEAPAAPAAVPGKAPAASATTSDQPTVAVEIFGTDPGWRDLVPQNKGDITLGERSARDLDVAVGDRVHGAGQTFTVSRIAPQEDYAHLAVAYTTTDTVHAVLDGMRQSHEAATVLLVSDAKGVSQQALGGEQLASLDADTGTTTQDMLPSLLAIDSFKAEISSLGMMVGMLMLASVLVVGVFFLVWSIQRQRDVAVLKALGATDGWLQRDALGQAALILAVGIGAGVGLTMLLGLVVGPKMPFVTSWLTTAVPAAGMFIAGLLGSLVSLRQITRADPLQALAAA